LSPSFGVTSCAIYLPERIFTVLSTRYRKTTGGEVGGEGGGGKDDEDNSSLRSSPPSTYDAYSDIISHSFGGFVGGGVMGSLFRVSVSGGFLPGAMVMGVGGWGLGYAERGWGQWKEEQRRVREGRWKGGGEIDGRG